MESNRELQDSITRTINDLPIVSEDVRKAKLSKLTILLAGVTYIILGLVGYITNLNVVIPIILVALGIPGIIAGITGIKGLTEDNDKGTIS